MAHAWWHPSVSLPDLPGAIDDAFRAAGLEELVDDEGWWRSSPLGGPRLSLGELGNRVGQVAGQQAKEAIEETIVGFVDPFLPGDQSDPNADKGWTWGVVAVGAAVAAAVYLRGKR